MTNYTAEQSENLAKVYRRSSMPAAAACLEGYAASLRERERERESAPNLKDKAELLIDIVRTQCGGFTTGPGYEAFQAAIELRAALEAK